VDKKVRHTKEISNVLFKKLKREKEKFKKIKDLTLDPLILSTLRPLTLAPPNCQNSLLTRKQLQLSDFKIGQKLGSGRFGEVFIAQHVQTGFWVAIKKLSKMNISLLRSEHRTVNEICIHKSLEHANIIKLYNHFQTEEDIYLVMELASEGSLYDLLKKQPNKKVTEKTAKKIIRQVLDAFSYLHKNDLIHRDLKPENLMISLVIFFP
jgi:serine/threonine protein kinase